MNLHATILWIYAAMTSLVLGASAYEALVVHPAWSRKPPQSFAAFMGETVGRMNIPAFWKPVAALYAISGLVAWAAAWWAGNPTVPLGVSAACAVSMVVWTLVYFRPTIERLLEAGAGNAPAERLQSEARRWILLNWIRVAVVAVSWWGALTATVAHG
jgi:hypothetical protein